MGVLAIIGIETTRFVVEKRVSIEKFTGYGLIIFGAFVLVAWIFQTPGFWIFQNPPNIKAWLVFIGLSILPVLFVYFKGKKNKENVGHKG